MSSSKSYLDFIMDQLSGLEGVSWRAMMGEYIIYYKEKSSAGFMMTVFLLSQPNGRGL